MSRSTYVIILGIALLGIIALQFLRVEAFEDKVDPEQLLGRVKRILDKIDNPDLINHVMNMVDKDPGQLARQHLESQNISSIL
jgi:hypothetical protein